jgi:uncharacterized Zn finger protein (UPF0148 family)
MNVLTSQLPSGGYGYSFSSVSVSPLSFLQITKYIEGCPENDNLEKYLYDLKMLIDEDKNVLDLYIMDADFLIFYKKLITVSSDTTFQVSISCPVCGHKVNTQISMNHDIHFKAMEKSTMEGAEIEMGNGHKYTTIVPTVREFFRVFERYLKFRKIEDLKLIKTISLIQSDYPNQVEEDVLGAKHSDITLLLALYELYFDRVETIPVFCPECNRDKKLEERREIAVSVDSLIADFFREVCINCPIDGDKILFKQVRESGQHRGVQPGDSAGSEQRIY